MIDDLIAYLMAIYETAKGIHYNCYGDAFYSKHLLADRVAENIHDYIDRLKENSKLGNDERPLLSVQYMQKAIDYMPDMSNKDDREKFILLQELIQKALNLINSAKVDKADENLIGEIAEDLKTNYGLINLQVER